MRAVIQRVSSSSVTVDDTVIGHIGKGLLVLLSVDVADSEADARYMASKMAGLRCFADEEGKTNLSITDVKGAILLISQFTLHGDCRKGRRPSFVKAARPELAIPLYEDVATQLREHHITVETGEFGSQMQVELVNDGPVTLLLDSKKDF